MMKLTRMESRILIYLSQVGDLNKSVAHIHTKMGGDYYYICGILRRMHAKGLLKRVVSKGGKNNKVVYTLYAKGEQMLPIAKKVLK